MSLWAIGTPCSGPRALPLARSASSARARLMAPSRSCQTKAWWIGSSRSIWSNVASSSSVAETSPSWIRSAASQSERLQSSDEAMAPSAPASVERCLKVCRVAVEVVDGEGCFGGGAKLVQLHRELRPARLGDRQALDFLIDRLDQLGAHGHGVLLMSGQSARGGR